MRHDWVFDVLSDLHAYARHNDLPRLAQKVELALIEARSELAEASPSDDPAIAPALRPRRRFH